MYIRLSARPMAQLGGGMTSEQDTTLALDARKRYLCQHNCVARYLAAQQRRTHQMDWGSRQGWVWMGLEGPLHALQQIAPTGARTEGWQGGQVPSRKRQRGVEATKSSCPGGVCLVQSLEWAALWPGHWQLQRHAVLCTAVLCAVLCCAHVQVLWCTLDAPWEWNSSTA